jgi:hypothetical protein
VRCEALRFLHKRKRVLSSTSRPLRLAQVVETAARSLRIILDREQLAAEQHGTSAATILFDVAPALGGDCERGGGGGAQSAAADKPELAPGAMDVDDTAPRGGARKHAGGSSSAPLPAAVTRLVQLVALCCADTAEAAAAVLARACHTATHQDALEQAGTLDAACRLLASGPQGGGSSRGSGCSKAQEAPPPPPLVLSGHAASLAPY